VAASWSKGHTTRCAATNASSTRISAADTSLSHEAQFVADLALTLASGLIGGWLARKVGLHPILGYVVAGLILGPFTPGYVVDERNLSILAELGLIFLLFMLGLEFSLAEIRKLGASLLAMWLIAIVALVAAVSFAAKLAGFPHAITMGMCLLASSTAIGVAFLQDAKLLRERAGRLVVPILILEDLVAIVLLVVIDQPPSELSFGALLKPLLLSMAFILLALTLGATIVRQLVVRTLAGAAESERTAVFIGIALSAAFIGYLFGLPIAFGAFVAGAVVATIEARNEVEKVVAPFKDLFVLCFFVSIGNVIDPALVIANSVTVVALSFLIVAVRGAIWWLFAHRSGIAGIAALGVAVAMVPLGEFNVVLAQAGAKAGRLTDAELATCTGVLLGSIVIASLIQPLLLRMSSRWPAVESQPA
jgi:K+:H+ antiporter